MPKKIKIRRMTAAEKEAARVRKNDQARAKRRAEGRDTRAEYEAKMAVVKAKAKAKTPGRTREQYLADVALTRKRAAPLMVSPDVEPDYPEEDISVGQLKLKTKTDEFLRLLFAEKLTAIREGITC
jgi:hypothetical protein